MNLRLFIGIGITIGLAVAILLGYHHYAGVLSDRDRLGREVADLRRVLSSEQAARSEAERAVSEWREAAQRQQKVAEDLRRVAHEALEERRRLERFFAERSLSGRATESPSELADTLRIDNDRFRRMLECVSGGSCPEPAPAGGGPAGAAPSADPSPPL